MNSRPGLALLLVIWSALAARIILLPILPIPQPQLPDEFSYLLMGSTFASGRAANPTHPMWRHFESLFILQQPTYASAYPPVQGLFLAAGQIIGGHPWVGVWLSAGLLCGAICWMLQAWMPGRWAFYGGMFAVAQFGVLSYWMNSYWGGAPCALGGALAYGAFGRMLRRTQTRDALWLGLGVSIMATSRPYEAVFATAPIFGCLAWRWRSKTADIHTLLVRHLIPLSVALSISAVAAACYFARVTGNPFRMPAQEYIRQYAAGAAFVWQAPVPEPAYSHPQLREAHRVLARDMARYSSTAGFVRRSLSKLRSFYFLLGPAVLVPIIAIPLLLRDSRCRILLFATTCVYVGMLLAVPYQIHYAAPVTAVAIALMVNSFRRLRAMHRRAAPLVSALMLAVPVLSFGFGMRDAMSLERRPSLVQRHRLETTLKASGHRFLVFVRYGRNHQMPDEWVYNDPDVDRADVVWARDLGAANDKLAAYYRKRVALIAEVDETPPRVCMYQWPSRSHVRPSAQRDSRLCCAMRAACPESFMTALQRAQ